MAVFVAAFVCAASPVRAQTCLEDSTGDNFNCEAEDVSITSIVVKPGGLIDGCTSEADTATVDLRVTIEAAEPTRYDIGMFIALDGGDALTGSCLHDYLGPSLSPPGTLDLSSGSGPYRAIDADACGDVQDGEVNVKDLGVLVIPCSDVDDDDFVDLGTVTTWDQNAGNNCTGVAQALPGNAAKCRATRNILNLPITPPTTTTTSSSTSTSSTTSTSTSSTTSTSSASSSTSTSSSSSTSSSTSSSSSSSTSTSETTSTSASTSTTSSTTSSSSSTSTTETTSTSSSTSTTETTSTSVSSSSSTSSSSSSSSSSSTSTSEPSTTSTSTTSTSTTLPLQTCDCGGFPFLVANRGRLNNDAVVMGSLGANLPTSGLLRIGRRVYLADGTTVAAALVRLGDESSVYDLNANTMFASPSSTVRNLFTSPLSLPLVDPFCELPQFACGGAPVMVAPGETTSLPAGTYGGLLVGDGAVLTLDPGVAYTFCDVRVGRGAAIESAGQATINVDGNIRVGAGSRLWTPTVPNDLPLVLNVAGGLVRISQADVVEAIVTAPNAKLRIQRAGELHGCFCVEDLTTDKNVLLECVE